MSEPKRVFLIAGEHSGDFLGAALMSTLDEQMETRPVYAGVGGEHMKALGFQSLFPLDEVAVMGLSAVIPRLPTLFKRAYEAVDAAIEFRPDVVIAIDSPEFTHAIAKRIRRKMSQVPVINYVSPSVWAWRPGRAKKMRAYVDHILALLPFEPDAHQRLGGPLCSYVGHPLVEKLDYMRNCDPGQLRQQLGIGDDARIIAVLPGSRPNEVKRLMQPFGETVRELSRRHQPLEVLIPAVDHVRPLIEQELQSWPLKPHLLQGEAQKFAAFNLAEAALAASGTVTLEMGLAGLPMVVAYRVSKLEIGLRSLVAVHSIVLSNLVLGENAFPEYIQEDCTAENLAPAVDELMNATPGREAQRAALAKLREKIMLPDGQTPAQAAGAIVRSYLETA